MAYHENLKILALTGRNPIVLAELLHYLTKKGYPKVEMPNPQSQIEHLASAGQHRLVTDAIASFGEYHRIQHEFPGQLVLVGIAHPSDISTYKRTRENGKPRQHLVEIAHHYIEEADSLQMQHELHALLEEIHFLN